jgi:MYXO-CTERM domain-containing protein
MRTRHAFGFALVSTLALTSSFALADTLVPNPGEGASLAVKQSNAAQVLLVAHGNYGRMTGDMRLNYAGHEQADVVSTENHLTIVMMESTTDPGLGPVQCTCSSYELQANAAPKLIANKRLTEFGNGERRCNHPRAEADEKGNILFTFGSDFDSDRPNLYAGILNNKCEQLAAPKIVSIPRNANDGAPPKPLYFGNGDWGTGYYSDGGGETGPFPAEGGDYGVAVGLHVDQAAILPTLAVTYVKPVLTTGSQIRQTFAKVNDNRAISCGMVGGNRPGDRIECALFDSHTGDVITKNTFYQMRQANPQRGISMAYFNQPSIARLTNDEFALMAIETTGTGKNTDIQASNVTHIVPIKVIGDTMVAGNEITGVGVHQSHATICGGQYGEGGKPAIAAIGAAKAGVGRGHAAMVTFDPGTQSFAYNEKEDLWPATWYSDSGKLANLYGRNPMEQGRDFMSCIGGVKNPGYHVANGYMADVESFFVATIAGRRPGDRANSMFLSLVPGKMDKKVTPQNPLPAGETPVVEPDPATAAPPKPKSDSGCGCSTPGTSNTSGLAAIGGLALGLGLVISRRRRSK